MDKFSLKEIVIYVGAHGCHRTECEIIGELRERMIGTVNNIICEAHPVFCYEVSFEDGKKVCVKEKYLRKKKPPQEKLLTWEELKKDLGMGETVNA